LVGGERGRRFYIGVIDGSRGGFVQVLVGWGLCDLHVLAVAVAAGVALLLGRLGRRSNADGFSQARVESAESLVHELAGCRLSFGRLRRVGQRGKVVERGQ
jgi:hypothetical protein